jgi:carboxymethylenebutenolidase
MELVTEWITYPAPTTVVPAYTARPRNVSEPLPAIIIIQEVWGVDDHIRDLVHRFATAGYLAAAPDLYAHDGERPDTMSLERVATVKRHLDAAPPAVWSDPAARDAVFNQLPAAERTAALETAAALLNPQRPIAQFMDDLTALTAHLRALPQCTGRVGSVGYCLGGMLSALLAARVSELGGAVIYYGSSPDAATMQPVQCPLLGFYGANDTRITSGVGAFGDALRGAGKSYQAHVYPDTPHAFFNDTRPSYRVRAARDAWARTLSFFAQQLAPGFD